MRMSWWPLALIIGLTALLTYVLYPRERNRTQLRAWRAEEERDLAELSIKVGDVRYCVDGVSAPTVHRTEEVRSMDSGHVVTFLATRYLRNPAGEYFVWMWRSYDKPYVKHMPHENARIVLKRKYVPPEGDA